MSNIYLVRHGLRLSRNEDTLLSPTGMNQAELTGKFLKDKNITKIIVSPLKRTIDTAEIINSYLKVPLTPDDRLRERMEYVPEFGTFDAFLEEWDKTMADRHYQPQIGHSAWEAGRRVLELIAELPSGNYVFVSHGGTIGDTVRNLLDDSHLTLTTDHKHLSWLTIPECSVTKITGQNHKLLIKEIASTAHLDLLK